MEITPQPITIAIDAMGGDRAPAVIVEGVRAFYGESEARVLLVGRRDEIIGCGGGDIGAEIVDAPDIVEMHDAPSMAIRKKRNSSMAVAVRMVHEGKAQAIVSLGNTGALMAFGKTILGTLPGIHRPAIAVPLPNRCGTSLLLDAGANAEATPEHLRDFAIMGEVYFREVLGKEKPRVGLLNLGSEEIKGKELTKSAAKLIRELPMEFVGNVEGGDISHGDVDVVVCDGFTGNVVLKYGEGLAELLVSTVIRQVSLADWDEPMKKAVQDLIVQTLIQADYCETGGAPLLGLQGTCIKSHGRSKAKAVTNALHGAARAASHRINEIVNERLAAVSNNGKRV